MSSNLESQAKTVQQIIDDNIGIRTLLGKPEKANEKWVRLEDAQKEIQKTEKKLEDLHSDFISTSEAWQKTINKNKVLEGCLSRIRSLIKEFPKPNRLPLSELFQFSIEDTEKIIKIMARLEKELKT
jgi:hypothetical protein